MEFSLMSGDFLMNVMTWAFVFLSNLMIRLPNADPNLTPTNIPATMAGAATAPCNTYNCMFDQMYSGSTYWPFRLY